MNSAILSLIPARLKAWIHHHRRALPALNENANQPPLTSKELQQLKLAIYRKLRVQFK
jgi:hypothetical protein